VWTTLQNFESSDGRTFALVDSGLDSPKGLAFDHNSGNLYVADSGAEKIFRYTVLVDLSGSRPTLATSGVRLTISQGHKVEWLAVDEDGNLFYTAPDTNNINKITAEVMQRIAVGEFPASQLQIVSEKEVEAQAATQKRQRLANHTAKNALPTDPPPAQPEILSIYESELNPHVSSPASIWVEGEDLYWTNQRDGTTAGTVVKGQAHPKTKVGKDNHYPAQAMTNVSSGAYGLGLSKNVMFFSRDGTKNGTGLVTGLLMGTDITIDFVTQLAAPRGLVWDRDQTMYVADQSGGTVSSFPAGRMMSNVPITTTVRMDGAYGLVLLCSSDPAFKDNRVQTGGQAAMDENLATQAALALKHPARPSFLQFVKNGYESMGKSFAYGEQGPLAIVVGVAFTVSMLAGSA